MFNNLHMMLDLETLSLQPNARILSIAVVSVNRPEDYFYRKIKFEENTVFDVDTETLNWWNTQDPLVKQEAFSGQEYLRAVLEDFCKWFPSDAHIWAKGADFDFPILGYALNYYGFKPPWFYRNKWCFRTLHNMFPDIKSPANQMKHSALADAMTQAAHLAEIMKTTPQFGW